MRIRLSRRLRGRWFACRSGFGSRAAALHARRNLKTSSEFRVSILRSICGTGISRRRKRFRLRFKRAIYHNQPSSKDLRADRMPWHGRCIGLRTL
jgi:hypothetical protein